MGFLDDLKKAGKEIARSLKDIKTAPFVQEMCKTTANMYRLGWDERNGGNISGIVLITLLKSRYSATSSSFKR